MRQQTVNGRMRPVKGPTNRMQRLSRFPAAPHVSPLRPRKLQVFPLRHRHHLGRKIYIRWCCIDLLNSPDFHDRSLSRGQELSRRATEERGCKFFLDFSPRVLASQPWFLFQIEPDFHLLSQTSEWSCTEDGVCVSCQS